MFVISSDSYVHKDILSLREVSQTKCKTQKSNKQKDSEVSLFLKPFSSFEMIMISLSEPIYMRSSIH